MKKFESKQFYVWGTTGNYPEIGEFVRYFVTKKEPDDGMSNLNPDARIGCFESTESEAYDNANVISHDIPEEIFGEVFMAYQQYLKMPVYFWNDDPELRDGQRNELLGIGAKFCRDEQRETRWFDKEDCWVYKLGEHSK